MASRPNLSLFLKRWVDYESSARLNSSHRRDDQKIRPEFSYPRNHFQFIFTNKYLKNTIRIS
jgi:hypothetical protein